MAVPTVFAPIKSGDFTLTPITVHKQFELSGSQFLTSGSGYLQLEALYRRDPTPIGAPQANNDPTNSIDGSYKHVIWKSIDHMYYRNPYNTYSTFEHANRRHTFKYLGYSASVLSFPYMDYGESIKPGSFQWSSSADNTIRWRDDGNGNIYDVPYGGISLQNLTNRLVAHWGFNDEFRRFPQRDGTVSFGRLKYSSRTFEPDEPSEIKNIYFNPRVDSSNTYTMGMQAGFNGQSYIMTHDRPEFNPGKNEGFAISMFVRIPTTQSIQTSPYNTILSKRGTIRKNVYGVNENANVNGLVQSYKFVSSSIEDSLVDSYPYDIEFINSTGGSDQRKVRFRRSDGIKTIEITSSATHWNVSGKNHIAVNIDTGSATLYVNGNAYTKQHSQLEEINNKHSILFGSLNRNGTQALSGSLDEIRFYDRPLDPFTDLFYLRFDQGILPHQTAIIGNIFYKQGIVVISPLNSSYLWYLSTASGVGNAWCIKYQSTHTIYQYETLCRVKKGAFNLTYNPTARQSFKSDLLINDMTGSVLMPYATTIGLYNDQGDLVAVGKLGQAVQMRDDVDLNFLVRWDA